MRGKKPLREEKRNVHIRPLVIYAESTFEISRRLADAISRNQTAFQLRYSKALIKITAEKESPHDVPNLHRGHAPFLRAWQEREEPQSCTEVNGFE